MQSAVLCCPRGRSSGTGGVLFKLGAHPLGPLETRFLELATAQAGDPAALLVTRTEALARWSDPDTADNRSASDGGELHVVLAVAAEDARLLGGICLEYFPDSSIAMLRALFIDDQHQDPRHDLRACLIRHADRVAHVLAESGGDALSDISITTLRPRPCAALTQAKCALGGIFAEMLDPRGEIGGEGAEERWARMARLERLGVRALLVERDLKRGAESVVESVLAVSTTPLHAGREALLAVLPRHGASENSASLNRRAGAFVKTQCRQPRDATPWSDVHPCALRLERPALEIQKFAIALHYVSTPSFLTEPGSEAVAPAKQGRAGNRIDSRAGHLRSETPPNDPGEVFSSFERDILAYAYRDTPPFVSDTDLDQPPGGRPVTLRLPNEIGFTSEGERTLLCGASDDPTGRHLPLRAILNRTVFPSSGIQVLHLTLVPDPDEEFVFSEYDLIKIAKLCEGGEDFRAELVEFHAPRPGGRGDDCPFARHDQQCRFVEFHDLFHDERDRSFQNFPHGCSVWRYCEPLGATVQIFTERASRPEEWKAVFDLLRPSTTVRTPAPLSLDRDTFTSAKECFPTIADRTVAVGGILQCLLDFDRIDLWELRDVLQPIVAEDGYLLYLQKGVLLNVTESDRAADSERCRAYIGVNPYLLAAHTVLLHNEEVLKLARFEVRHFASSTGADGRKQGLADLRHAYLYLDDALHNDFLPNVFHYPIERTIYDAGHREHGLAVEREALERQFERVGRTIEAAEARISSGDQVRLSIVALIVGLFATWQVIQPIYDYGAQVWATLTSRAVDRREVAMIVPIVPASVPGDTRGANGDVSTSIQPASASAMRVETVQPFEPLLLALFGVLAVLCSWQIVLIVSRRWRIVRSRRAEHHRIADSRRLL